jgi:citrate synthase
MLEEIGSVANVRPYVEKCIANKQKVMGFGHRVYKVKDLGRRFYKTLPNNYSRN